MDGRDTLANRREQMVARQLVPRGISDQRVLEAMRSVPREAFVPPHLRDYAYEDDALPIGYGQTISQPYIVALMAQEARIKPTDRVLDVGTGSGYGAAVLSRIAAQVYSVERHADLGEAAWERIKALGYDNVQVRIGNGWGGWPEHAPFDAVIVAARGAQVPQPLLDQLAIGGRLIIPVGENRWGQELIRITRESETEYTRDKLGAVAFVPLVNADALLT